MGAHSQLNYLGPVRQWDVRYQPDGRPHHGYVPVTCAVHVTLFRRFVDFLLRNETALDLLEWVKKVYYPDEAYFSTLNFNPQLGVPGSFKGMPEIDPGNVPLLARYKIWFDPRYPPCFGKFVRAVCIFGLRDLPSLTKQYHLFVNKFHWDYQHYALKCLEEWHYNKTRDGYLDGKDFDVSEQWRNITFPLSILKSGHCHVDSCVSATGS